MYSVLGTIVYAVMSADGSCRGLRSPRDGPLVMEFTQGEYTIFKFFKYQYQYQISQGNAAMYGVIFVPDSSVVHLQTQQPKIISIG